MPGKGQKSITISDELYDSLRAAWKENRNELFANYEIATLSSYAQRILERGIKQDVLEGRFKIISRDDNVITVRDYFKAKDFDVAIRKSKLFCESDQESDCEHVGYVLHDPEVIERAKELGVKLRKTTPKA